MSFPQVLLELLFDTVDTYRKEEIQAGTIKSITIVVDG